MWSDMIYFLILQIWKRHNICGRIWYIFWYFKYGRGTIFVVIFKIFSDITNMEDAQHRWLDMIYLLILWIWRRHNICGRIRYIFRYCKYGGGTIFVLRYDIFSDITNMEEAQYLWLYSNIFWYYKYEGGTIFVVGYDISSDITIDMEEAQYLLLYRYFLIF